MNTVTAEQFVKQGFAVKIANGECIVIDEQFAESPLVKDITVQYRDGSELYMILYADVTDPNDTVTGRADDTFRITWIKPNPMDKSMQTIGAALGLSGQFKEQYGTAHIEQAVKVIMEDREIITDIRNLCMKAQDERDELARKLMAAVTIEEMSSTLLPDGHEVKGLGCFIEHDGQKLLFFESSVVSDLQHDLSVAKDRIAVLEQSEQMLLKRIKKLRSKSELDDGFIDHLLANNEDSQ